MHILELELADMIELAYSFCNYQLLYKASDTVAATLLRAWFDVVVDIHFAQLVVEVSKVEFAI